MSRRICQMRRQEFRIVVGGGEEDDHAASSIHLKRKSIVYLHCVIIFSTMSAEAETLGGCDSGKPPDDVIKHQLDINVTKTEVGAE